MTTVVLDSKDLVESLTTGEVPVPAGIAEDNAAQAAKKDGNGAQEPAKAVQTDVKIENPDPAAEAAKEVEALDDVEGEDGLTPRQKREFTASMQKTIAKKHRMQREAEEFAAEQYNEKRLAEQRAEQLERELKRLQVKPEPVQAEAKAPDRKDFETDQAYQDALIDYRVDQKLKAQAAEQAKRDQERKQQEILSAAAARIERAIELVPDFKEVTEAVDMEVPPAVAGYMQRSTMFAELGYHLAKHPDVLERLQSLPPDEQLVEIGEIKSTLKPFAALTAGKAPNGEEPSRSNGEKPSTETGTAPSKPRVQAPILRPLNAGSAAQVGKDEAEMNTAEVIASWQKKHGARITARKRH